MFKYTTNTLNKLEAAFKEAGYIVRYEKGSFNAGYCILQDKRVVVVNKYYSLESRITCLVDILAKVEIPVDSLSSASQSLLNKILHQNTPS